MIKYVRSDIKEFQNHTKRGTPMFLGNKNYYLIHKNIHEMKSFSRDKYKNFQTT